jgi:hypothetical protein
MKLEMKRKWFLPTLIILVLAGTLLVVASVSAVTGFSLDWWTVDGGGGNASAGGGYSLDGTIGQPDAGSSSGDTYTLASGFWVGDPSPVTYQIFLPLVKR